MKPEFKIISQLIDENSQVLDVPDFLKALKNFLDKSYFEK